MLVVSEIGTHDLYPHADDIFAVATALLIFPSAKIKRTRSVRKLAKCQMRIDVGGKYLPPSDFDHHQPDFKECREDGRPFASAGLVAHYFWRDLLHSYFTWEVEAPGSTEKRDVFLRVDDLLFSFIDAVDNGVETYERIPPYNVYDLHSVLAQFIPNSMALKNLRRETQRQMYDDGFMRACEFAQNIIKVQIDNGRVWVRDQELVRRAIKAAEQKDSRLIILKRSAAWGKAIAESAPDALFVVSRDEIARNWSIQTVPMPGERFSSKKLLPKAWAGLRGKELVNASGISGAIFCHSARFLAIAKTKEAVLEMAERVLD